MHTRPLATRWRLLLTPPLPGAENMALDVALMGRARRTGEAVFRIYTWATPTLSFGRNQTAKDRYRLDRIAELGYGVVRRPTGGRAILHHREITYSVAAPASEAVGLKRSYLQINAILLAGLARLGVAALPAPSPTRAMRPTEAPCFATPGEGEMVVEGQKLVGSAQWRDEGALLQHGSILVDDDQQALAALAITTPNPVPPPGTLRALLGRAPAPAEVAEALFGAVRTLEDAGARALTLDELLATDPPDVDFFLGDQWTWRR